MGMDLEDLAVSSEPADPTTLAAAATPDRVVVTYASTETRQAALAVVIEPLPTGAPCGAPRECQSRRCEQGRCCSGGDCPTPPPPDASVGDSRDAVTDRDVDARDASVALDAAAPTDAPVAPDATLVRDAASDRPARSAKKGGGGCSVAATERVPTAPLLALLALGRLLRRRAL